MTDAYPLQWPGGWTRTRFEDRRRAPYQVGPDQAGRELLRSLRLLGAIEGTVIVSSNIPPRRDGLPYASGSKPSDSGVAIYWSTIEHDELVMACDRWLDVHDNLRAIGLAIDGLRAMERAGASQILNRAFQAFGALPPSAEAAPVRPWWYVLNFPEALIGALSVAVVEARYRELASKAHPDKGGSDAAMAELNRARDEARKHYGGGA